MSKCTNCGTEFTLKEEEIKCDNCGKVVNFICHNCNQWFAIDETNLCKVCGFYICPTCKICGVNCQKDEWQNILKEIIPTITEEQLKKVIELIEEIKIGKEQRNCPRGVSISYAKGRIKSCIVRMMGYRIKNEADLNKFKERVDKIRKTEIGKEFTITGVREYGSYGQEYRDVFNYLICLGEIKKIKIKKEEIEYEVFRRCEEGSCPMLDVNNLIIKICKNPKCKIKEFPLSQTECCYCKYKRGNKKGEFYPLRIKISNKDTCQLPRGEFKKEENGEKINN